MGSKFIFRGNQIIGAADAESDNHFLNECFIDTGDLGILRNCDDPRFVLIGRTGTGKSALIKMLPSFEEHVINLKPESLSLSYITNSSILRFFSEAGVKLDIFYRLLWRHIFCVELIKERFQINSEEKRNSFLTSVWSIIPKNKKYETSLKYLRDWGESFWKETEYRIKEVTQKLENELKAEASASLPKTLKLKSGVARKLSEEEKGEIVHIGQEVVNKVQIKELSAVLELLDEILSANKQQKFFVTIDKLDEDWIEDEFRYRLIRALIETGMDFHSQVKNVKIIVAIRNDLLERVFRNTRDPGFQEEKILSSCLTITWTNDHLIEVLNSRINLVYKEQYTKQQVSYSDLLIANLGKQKTIDFILDRTFHRPRDIIQFFNSCILESGGKSLIGKKAILEAEGNYSRDRLKALFDEWFGIYPNLDHLYIILRERNPVFQVQDLSEDDLTKNYLGILVSGQAKPGIDLDLVNQFYEGAIDFNTYRRSIINIFYNISLVGIRPNKGIPLSWSYKTGRNLSISEIKADSKIFIHPMFFRVLGITGDE